MAQQAKMLVAKPGDLSLIPRIHMVEEENSFPSTHGRARMYTCIHAHMRLISKRQRFKGMQTYRVYDSGDLAQFLLLLSINWGLLLHYDMVEAMERQRSMSKKATVVTKPLL